MSANPLPAMRNDWRGGWWRAAAALPSPHNDDRPPGLPVNLLVIHTISLPPGEYGGPAIEALFNGRIDPAAHPYFDSLRGLRVSSHFLIRRDGTTLQFVDVFRRAWHAGRSKHRGRERCNDFSVGVELEGLDGHRFECAQYAALSRLSHALAEVLPIDAVAGHEHIAPGRKGDPGAGMDWPRLRRDCADLGWYFP